MFSRHGIWDTLHSDNGPQFGSDDFKQFADQWGFEHVTSSPLYAQSNGEVERTVQTMKAKLNKCDDEYFALLSYRDTPLHNGYSPAQLSMGRKLRSRVPCHPDGLLPRIPDYDELCRHERRYREKMEQNYNRRHRVVEGERLCSGYRVWIPDLRTEGSVVKHHDTPRSVVVQTQRSTVRRNRRMTRKLQNQPDIEPIVNTSEPLRPCRATVPATPATSSDDEPEAVTQEVHPERSVEPEENLESVTTMAPRRSERPRRPPRRYIEEY